MASARSWQDILAQMAQPFDDQRVLEFILSRYIRPCNSEFAHAIHYNCKVKRKLFLENIFCLK